MVSITVVYINQLVTCFIEDKNYHFLSFHYKECDDEHYGEGCMPCECKMDFMSGKCDKLNGTCHCLGGYQGTFCNQSKSKNLLFLWIWGVTVLVVLVIVWIDFFKTQFLKNISSKYWWNCLSACVNGFYGLNCLSTCACNDCHHVTGCKGNTNKIIEFSFLFLVFL